MANKTIVAQFIVSEPAVNAWVWGWLNSKLSHSADSLLFMFRALPLLLLLFSGWKWLLRCTFATRFASGSALWHRQSGEHTMTPSYVRSRSFACALTFTRTCRTRNGFSDLFISFEGFLVTKWRNNENYVCTRHLRDGVTSMHCIGNSVGHRTLLIRANIFE